MLYMLYMLLLRNLSKHSLIVYIYMLRNLSRHSLIVDWYESKQAVA